MRLLVRCYLEDCDRLILCDRYTERFNVYCDYPSELNYELFNKADSIFKSAACNGDWVYLLEFYRFDDVDTPVKILTFSHEFYEAV